MNARRGHRAPDRGSATVLVLGWLFVLVAAASLVLATGEVALARRRAATGADLAALAAAMDRTGDPVTACRLAADYATRNGSELVGCRAAGGAVEVVVSVALPPELRAAGSVRVTARAGPWLGAGSTATPTPTARSP